MALWKFTNVTKSLACWPTLSGLEFTDSHPQELASFGATLVDPENLIEFDLDDELLVEYSMNERDYTTVFGGVVTDRTMTDMGRDAPRVWQVAASDYVVRLADTLITGTRPAESAAERVAWIVAFLPDQGITATVLDGLGAPLEAHEEYGGVTKIEALDEVAQFLDATWYVDFDKVLHFYTGFEAYTAPFALVHPADPPDSYPYWNFELTDSLADAATRVLVQGKDSSLWRINAAAETELGREIQRQISDDRLDTTAKMEAAGDTFLANAWPPPRKGSATLLTAGLRSGQLVHVTYPEWADDGVDADFVISSVSVEFLEPNTGTETELPPEWIAPSDSTPFGPMTMWWPYWRFADLAFVEDVAADMAYMNQTGVILMGMQWGSHYALPSTDLLDKLDAFIAAGVTPYLGLWVGKLDGDDQSVGLSAWGAGSGRWGGIVLDAENQWVNHVKDNPAAARSDFDDFMAIFRPLTANLAVACYASPTSFPNYKYEWWNESVDTFLPLAYFNSSGDTAARILSTMYRKFNAVSADWDDPIVAVVPVMNGYRSTLSDAEVAQRRKYLDIAFAQSGAAQVWRWIGSFPNNMREMLHDV